MTISNSKNGKNKVPIRLIILFFCVFYLFILITMQLRKVQFIDGYTYKNVVKKRENATINITVLCGKTWVNSKALIRQLIGIVITEMVTYENDGERK
ncbi:cell division protein FtsI/penicillin-binding protein 2 [Bacillus sp. RC242]